MLTEKQNESRLWARVKQR